MCLFPISNCPADKFSTGSSPKARFVDVELLIDAVDLDKNGADGPLKVELPDLLAPRILSPHEPLPLVHTEQSSFFTEFTFPSENAGKSKVAKRLVANQMRVTPASQATTRIRLVGPSPGSANLIQLDEWLKINTFTNRFPSGFGIWTLAYPWFSLRLESVGGPARIRTWDQRIMSPLL